MRVKFVIFIALICTCSLLACSNEELAAPTTEPSTTTTTWSGASDLVQEERDEQVAAFLEAIHREDVARAQREAARRAQEARKAKERGDRATRPPAASEPGTKTYLGRFKTTCYQLTGTTASGARAGWGRVAVDPRVIALGTKLYIAGYGDAVAADTGGAIQGGKIDVWKSSCSGYTNPTVDVWRIA